MSERLPATPLTTSAVSSTPSGILALSTSRRTTSFPTLSLHDALPISLRQERLIARLTTLLGLLALGLACLGIYGVMSYADRKSTRLNSSHLVISYAVFCLKKKTDNTFSYYVALLS